LLIPARRDSTARQERGSRGVEFSSFRADTVRVLGAASKAIQAPNPTRELFHSLIPLWPLWAVVAAVGAGKVLIYAWKMRRLRRAGMFEIDQMDGRTFERKLAVLFRNLGYRAEVVGGSGDYGCDLIVSKDGKRTVVQAKCYRKNVGVKAVQEVLGGREYHRADAALVVTNARFTKNAQELARRSKVKLWGRDELTVALLKARKRPGSPEPVVEPVEMADEPAVAVATPILTDAPEAQPTAMAVAAVPASAGFCARCGEPVSVKVQDYCFNHPERFSGLVYCYKDQRAFKRH
jgi:restriction system protein